MAAKVPEKILKRNRLQEREIKLKNELFLVQSELWRDENGQPSILPPEKDTGKDYSTFILLIALDLLIFGFIAALVRAAVKNIFF